MKPTAIQRMELFVENDEKPDLIFIMAKKREVYKNKRKGLLLKLCSKIANKLYLKS